MAVESGTDKLLQTVMEDTWYKSLKDADTFYTKVIASQFMMYITSTHDGLHFIIISNTTILIQWLWPKVNTIPEFANILEGSQQNSQRGGMPIPDMQLEDITA